MNLDWGVYFSEHWSGSVKEFILTYLVTLRGQTDVKLILLEAWKVTIFANLPELKVFQLKQKILHLFQSFMNLLHKCTEASGAWRQTGGRWHLFEDNAETGGRELLAHPCSSYPETQLMKFNILAVRIIENKIILRLAVV